MSPKVSEEHKEQRRRQILEAAERVFIRMGYEPATLKDIVQEAGMSRGWIYLYFQTKEEIFEALMEKHDQESEEIFNALLAGSSSVWEALERMLQLQKEELSRIQSSKVPAVYEYFVTGWRDERKRERLVLRSERSVRRLVQFLQVGVDRGEFSPALPLELIAKVMMSQFEGIMIHTLAIGPEHADTFRQLDVLITHMKSLLLPSK
jgi:AcrR family transcriptional regulator